MPDDEIKKILNLINNCTKAKSKKNYCVADEILEELKVACAFGFLAKDVAKASLRSIEALFGGYTLGTAGTRVRCRGRTGAR